MERTAACLNEYFNKDSIFWVSDDSGESSDENIASVDIPPEIPPRLPSSQNVNSNKNVIFKMTLDIRNPRHKYGSSFNNAGCTQGRNASGLNKKFRKERIFRMTGESQDSDDETKPSTDIPLKIPPRNATNRNLKSSKSYTSWKLRDSTGAVNKKSITENVPKVPPRNKAVRYKMLSNDVLFKMPGDSEPFMTEKSSSTDNAPMFPKRKSASLNKYFSKNSIFRMPENSEESSDENSSFVDNRTNVPPRNTKEENVELCKDINLLTTSFTCRHDSSFDKVSIVPARRSSSHDVKVDTFKKSDEIRRASFDDNSFPFTFDRNALFRSRYMYFSEDSIFRISEHNGESNNDTSSPADIIPKVSAINTYSPNVKLIKAGVESMSEDSEGNIQMYNSSLSKASIATARRCTLGVCTEDDAIFKKSLHRRSASLEDNSLSKNHPFAFQSNALCLNQYFSEDSIFRISGDDWEASYETSPSETSPRNTENPNENLSKAGIKSTPRDSTGARHTNRSPALKVDMDALKDKPSRILNSGKDGNFMMSGDRRRPNDECCSLSDNVLPVPERNEAIRSFNEYLSNLVMDWKSYQSMQEMEKVSPQQKIIWYSAFDMSEGIGRRIGGIHASRGNICCLFYRGGSQLKFVSDEIKNSNIGHVIDDLAIDHHNNIYVACTKAKGIKRISRNRVESPLATMQGYPRAIAYNPSYDELIVCLNDSCPMVSSDEKMETNKVIRLKVLHSRNPCRQDCFTEGLDYINVANTNCVDLISLYCPASVCVSANGDILFSDFFNRSVVVYDGKMNFKYTIRGDVLFDNSSLRHHPVVCCDKTHNRTFLLCNRSVNTTANVVVLDSNAVILEKIYVEDLHGCNIHAADFDTEGRLVVASDNIVFTFDVRF